MSAFTRVVRSGVGRRKVSTVVTGLAAMVSVIAAIAAGSLIVASQAPFDHAFTRQDGAHLTVQFDGARATPAQIAATARVPGVTAASGPFAEVETDRATAVPLTLGPVSRARTLGAMTLVGRADAGGAVDDVALTQGRWANAPGEIVLSATDAPSLPARIPLIGLALQFPDLPGRPTLTVVGVARSVSQTAGAWVAPSEITALASPSAAPNYQMLYRFVQASTDTQLSGDRAAITAALPRGAVTGSQSYLAVKTSADQNTAPFVPFIVAFGVLGLIMSVLVISTVVSGAVGTGTRRIGVLKALGFTPGHIVGAYLAQVLIPSLVGIALGVLFGNLLAAALLNNAENAYGTSSLSVAAWIDVAVPCAAVVIVTVAAFVPASRAGRLSAVEAIAVGRTPRAGRGRTVRRMLAYLPLPRPISLGLAGPFTRPVRALAIGTAIVFGATASTFAVGLVTSLHAVENGLDGNKSGAVTVSGARPSSRSPISKPPALDAAKVSAVIKAQPGTGNVYGVGNLQATVSGMTGTVAVSVFQGDASGNYQMISGHWYTGPGQAVVPTRFLQLSGAHLGETVTVVDNGTRTPVRVVGEVLDIENSGKDLLTDAATLGSDSNVRIDQFHITLTQGTNLSAYVEALDGTLQPLNADATISGGGGGGIYLAMDTITAILALMLVTIAALGVLNSVVIDTRERVHDLGVYKAIGMTPRQTISMVLASVAGVGLLAGLIGVPLGIAIHNTIVPAMGHAAGTGLPPADIAVYHITEDVLLGLAGIVIAVLGALPAASWAATTRTATALRTE